MKPTLKQWIDNSREKLHVGDFTENDLLQLEEILAEPKQMVLYLYSKSTNMRSPIISWALYDATQPHEATLPSQDLPYPSVIGAVEDGWRIVQFPISRLSRFSDIDNDYLGYEFILEKWTSAI